MHRLFRTLSLIALLGQPLRGAGIPAVSRPAAPSPSQAAFAEARSRFSLQTNDVEAAWQFGRATFDLAEVTSAAREREQLALEGIAACRAGLAANPTNAPSHYYLGMNLGQLARVRPLSALRLVHQIEDAFHKAQQLDPAFDHAGPDRNLGLLYRDAPGWPTSVGSRSKARKHLEAAAQRAPDHPENALCLAESYLQWKMPSEARTQAAALENELPQARLRLKGSAWESAWRDWDARWTNLLHRLPPPPHR